MRGKRPLLPGLHYSALTSFLAAPLKALMAPDRILVYHLCVRVCMYGGVYGGIPRFWVMAHCWKNVRAHHV